VAYPEMPATRQFYHSSGSLLVDHFIVVFRDDPLDQNDGDRLTG